MAHLYMAHPETHNSKHSHFHKEHNITEYKWQSSSSNERAQKVVGQRISLAANAMDTRVCFLKCLKFTKISQEISLPTFALQNCSIFRDARQSSVLPEVIFRLCDHTPLALAHPECITQSIPG